jgi:U3 small nucleolar RNA-associated protein 5
MAPSSAKRAVDSVIEPPSKRRRHSPHASTNGLSGVLLNGSNKKLNATYGRIFKDPKLAKVDDSHTVIGNGDPAMPEAGQADAIVISSDDSSDDESDIVVLAPRTNGVSHRPEGEGGEDGEDEVMMNGGREASIEVGDDMPAEEPTFGELLQAEAADVIDVEDALALAAEDSDAMAYTSDTRALTAPSSASLGAVLTQALRTNDRERLESCFEMSDIEAIKATIHRLPSHLVADLIRRVSERIYKRPGRAALLMIWIQWSLVAHGAYLASQFDVVDKLHTLKRVIQERAMGMPALLQLKGKLDMLSAQQELRRNMQRVRDRSADEDEAAVIYVEGQEDDSEEEETDEDVAVASRQTSKSRRKHQRDDDMAGDVSEGEAYGVPSVNGITNHTDDRSDVEGNLFDDEDDSEDEEDEETSDSEIEGIPEIEESDLEDEESSDEEGESQPAKPAHSRAW